MEIKKINLEMAIRDERDVQKAMKIVSKLAGVDSISMEMKEKKMKVTGEVDPICMVRKLRKFCHTEIISVGAAKEEKKKTSDEDKFHEIFNYYRKFPYNYCVEMPYEQPPTCVIC